MRDQRLVEYGEPGDRLEILDRVVTELAVEVRIHREGHVWPEQEGVAVGRGLGDVFGGELGVAAGLVLDDDLLVPGLRQLPRDCARGGIRCAARRRGHDDAHRPGRKGLRIREGRAADESDHCEQEMFHHIAVSRLPARVLLSDARQFPEQGLRHPVGGQRTEW